MPTRKRIKEGFVNSAEQAQVIYNKHGDLFSLLISYWKSGSDLTSEVMSSPHEVTPAAGTFT